MLANNKKTINRQTHQSCSEFWKSPKVSDNGINDYSRLSTALADVTPTSRLFGFHCSPGDSYVTSCFARHRLAWMPWSFLRDTVGL